MTIQYEVLQTLHENTEHTDWLHEGVGSITPAPKGFDLSCVGSKQGAQGCMAFFKTALPDQVDISYKITVHSQRGLVINYLSLRGIDGQDPFAPDSGLPSRNGIMANYWARDFGLQSYHLSFTRYNDKGVHTGTANIRRNPGGYLVGHGVDPVREVGTPFAIRITKDLGAIQMHVNGALAMSCVDHATNLGPIPDHGYFGFRLVGDDVRVTVTDFKVSRIKPVTLWDPWVYKP